MDLVERLLEGDRRAAARIISMIESKDPKARDMLSRIYQNTGNAIVVGITGPPGTGKSTLVSKLALELRTRGKKIGILAIDPTSPFTGGALLGDRIRMGEICMDKEVFIRSMGTRGSLGGLSWATADAIKVLDALGKDVIIVETVGAGQAEVDIVQTAHTSVVIVMPGLGDDIQTIKAGLMEIGNLFVVNKGDLFGAEKRKLEVEAMLHLGDHNKWMPPVLMTIAREGKGISEVVDGILSHWEYLKDNGLLKDVERRRARAEIFELLEQRIHALAHDLVPPKELEALLDKVVARELDPFSASGSILDTLFCKRQE